MSEDFNFELLYNSNDNDRLFAFLATNSEISKLAFKIQASKNARANALQLKKVSTADIY